MPSTARETIADAIRRLHVDRGERYRQGDVAGYLSFYAEDARIYHDGGLVTPAELGRTVAPLFEAGGHVVSLDLADPADMMIAEAGDAVVTRYPWRERFRHADGHDDDLSYFETNVWYLHGG